MRLRPSTRGAPRATASAVLVVSEVRVHVDDADSRRGAVRAASRDVTRAARRACSYPANDMPRSGYRNELPSPHDRGRPPARREHRAARPARGQPLPLGRPVRLHRGRRAAADRGRRFRDRARQARSRAPTRSGAHGPRHRASSSRRARPPRGPARARAARGTACRPRLGRRPRLVPARHGRAPARRRGSPSEIDDERFEQRRRLKDAHAIAAIREVTALVEESMVLIRRAARGLRRRSRRHAARRRRRAHLGAPARRRAHVLGRERARGRGSDHRRRRPLGDPHDVGSGPLRRGTPILCDLFPRSARPATTAT